VSAVAPADRPPTLHDVARRAGVHPATVSRALTKPDMVAAGTRSIVLDAVAAVGFVPNRSARHLVSGRADAIGVIVPDITNPYFASIVQAIQGDARADDLAVLIADTGADPAEERRALATLSRQVDGIVAITPITDLAAVTRPVVQVNRQRRKVVSVVVDQEAIALAAIDHLVALGHTEIAVVRGPVAYWSATTRDRAVSRLIGSSPAAARPLRIDQLSPAAATFDGGRGAYDEVDRSDVTAVVAFNDLQAAGLLVAAQEAGRTVPGSLSIVGSDGLALATMSSPPLTTVAAPLDDLGVTARQRLADVLADRPGPAVTTLQPSLVVRSSTAAPTRPTAAVDDRTRQPPEENRS
jgi:DNA-binding LacI/PurR family transcriptional regulator